MPTEQPYLSVVVTARNDDHGGDLLKRMQIFTNGWIEQAVRHNLSSELIIVEWNPPEGRPSLREALSWPGHFGPCEVRFIEVPPEIHAHYEHAQVLPLYQMIGKNVGIRRARGPFILATNIDILFSDELIEFLAQKRLQFGRMYRIDRHDAMSDVPLNASIDDQLEYCRTHLLRINAREGTFPVSVAGRRMLAGEDIAAPDSGLTFGRGWFAPERLSENEIFRWVDNDAEICFSSEAGRHSVLNLNLQPGPGMDGLQMVLAVFEGGELIATTEVLQRSNISISLPVSGREHRTLRLHVNAGNKPLHHDPRFLNFRVFSCKVEDASRDDGARSGEPAVHLEIQRSPIKRLATLWSQLQLLIARLAESRSFATITIPVSPTVRRAAAFYVESGGITGMVRHCFGLRPRNKPSERAVQPDSGEKAPEITSSPDPAVAFLHTNACGDFTLAAREHWFDLRAYPEFDLYSMNIDSVFCYAAHHGGAVEEVLSEPMRIYHIEHGTGSGWTPEGQAALFDRIRAKGMSWIEYPELVGWAAQMRKLNCPFIFNRENWGLADFDLPETHLYKRPTAEKAAT